MRSSVTSEAAVELPFGRVIGSAPGLACQTTDELGPVAIECSIGGRGSHASSGDKDAQRRTG